MGNDDTSHREVTLSARSGRQRPGQSGRSEAGFDRTQIPSAMCEQQNDWSHGPACIPQKFVQLIGHRDPNARVAATLPPRPMRLTRKPMPNDVPIG